MKKKRIIKIGVVILILLAIRGFMKTSPVIEARYFIFKQGDFLLSILGAAEIDNIGSDTEISLYYNNEMIGPIAMHKTHNLWFLSVDGAMTYKRAVN